MKKTCTTCGKPKFLKEFYKGDGLHGRRGRCIACFSEKRSERYYADVETSRKKNAEAARKWRENNPEKAKEISRSNQRRHISELRLQVLIVLGNACARCHVTEQVLLHVDHVNDDGADERRSFKGNMTAFYKHVLAFPDSYQLLCPNCNHRKRLESATGPTTKMSEYSARTTEKLKTAALECLGGVCGGCETDDKDVLCFDHKAGNGRADRCGLTGSRYADVIANPSKYQLLCHNCNWLKRHRCKEHGRSRIERQIH